MEKFKQCKREDKVKINDYPSTKDNQLTTVNILFDIFSNIST